jgi:hypothetical protein
MRFCIASNNWEKASSTSASSFSYHGSLLVQLSSSLLPLAPVRFPSLFAQQALLA